MSAGRPKKLTDAQKKGIIRNFVVEKGAAHLSEYNICAQLARYANDKQFLKDVKITADDFRDAVSRSAIKTMIDSAAVGRTPKPIGALPAYVPLDIDVLLTKTAKEIKQTLVCREQYSSDWYNRAATAIESFVDQEELIIELTTSVNELKSKFNELQDINKKITSENAKLRKKNADLLRDAKASGAVQTLNLAESYSDKITDEEIANNIRTDIISPIIETKPKKGKVTRFPSQFDDLI